MFAGDISNQVNNTIAFKCEDFLIKIKEPTLKDKILNVFGVNHCYSVNQTVRGAIEYIFRNTEETVDVVVETKNYKGELKKLLEDMPFNRVVLYDKPSQIATRLLSGDLTYYVDDDSERRSLINSRYAISFSEFQQIYRRKGRV